MIENRAAHTEKCVTEKYRREHSELFSVTHFSVKSCGFIFSSFPDCKRQKLFIVLSLSFGFFNHTMNHTNHQ